ncbi:metallophosphoesterase [Rubritalea tangerina]|uniref:Metallophosphoesterase n=1 Tax=Rubritalea tangerina TaxID=430798 RepID=A0ABW4ZCV5_9BACT
MTTRRQFNKQMGFAMLGSVLTSNNLSAAPKLGTAKAVSASKGIGKEGWTIAVIPDSQNYAKFKKNQQHFDLMTEWIAKHMKAWNIQLVLHEGDFVEQNDIAQGGGPGFGDQNAEEQWRSAQRSMSTLYGKVPTILATGNHDYGFRNAENRQTRFNNYFGLTDNPLTCDGLGGGIWREGFTNSFGATTLENAIYTLNAPDGRDILVASLEWGPRNEVVEWAKDSLGQLKYRNHFGILLTHSYLHDDNQRDGVKNRPGNPHRYPTGKGGNTNDGADLWEKLVKDSPNINLVLNGHVEGKHVGYRMDVKSNRDTVHQMLFNSQGLGGGMRENGNGGDGWIRLLTFEPDRRTLSVRTFSPFMEKLGKTAWNTGPGHNFTVEI